MISSLLYNNSGRLEVEKIRERWLAKTLNEAQKLHLAIAKLSILFATSSAPDLLLTCLV